MTACLQNQPLHLALDAVALRVPQQAILQVPAFKNKGTATMSAAFRKASLSPMLKILQRCGAVLPRIQSSSHCCSTGSP